MHDLFVDDYYLFFLKFCMLNLENYNKDKIFLTSFLSPTSVYMNLYDSNTSNNNQNLVIKLTNNTKNSLNNNSSSNSSSNIQSTSGARIAPIQAIHISSTRQASNNITSTKVISTSSKSSFNSNSTSKMATSIVQPTSASKRTSILQKNREQSANISSSLPRPQPLINARVISATSSRGMSAGRIKR